MIRRVCCLFLITLICTTATADEQVIRVNNFSDPNAAYAINMLRLALSHIDKPYRIDISTNDMTQARVNEEVRIGGNLDLAWTSSDARMEATVLPIRIPLFKGLLGYRILIINKHDQAKFDRVNTLEDLKQLTFGQGRTWADTNILESNGFTVIKTNKYPSLFHMVEGGRFDAFPRGVHEPFGELAQRPELELAVEKNLMLAYKMPFYLFVSKNNPGLANDIETGFNHAIANGSFDEAFMNAPEVKDVIEKANMKNRKVFYIDNPTLSPETPLDRAELWFDPKDLP
ncbi:diguanylate cyclase [Cellvibrio sp. ARAG 10.3]|uniref:diguanylate cyclase n=1 Tax=Cellvibrio sp. ARAG 10.3 TaxID=3451358 RepID=UPI003F48D721